MRCLRGDAYVFLVYFVCLFVTLTVSVSVGYRRAHCESYIVAISAFFEGVDNFERRFQREGGVADQPLLVSE